MRGENSCHALIPTLVYFSWCSCDELYTSHQGAPYPLHFYHLSVKELSTPSTFIVCPSVIQWEVQFSLIMCSIQLVVLCRSLKCPLLSYMSKNFINYISDRLIFPFSSSTTISRLSNKFLSSFLGVQVSEQPLACDVFTAAPDWKASLCFDADMNVDLPPHILWDLNWGTPCWMGAGILLLPCFVTSIWSPV